jgi:hypothetical protein
LLGPCFETLALKAFGSFSWRKVAWRYIKDSKHLGVPHEWRWHEDI